MSVSPSRQDTDRPSNVDFVFAVLCSNPHRNIVLEGSARHKRGRGWVEIYGGGGYGGRSQGAGLSMNLGPAGVIVCVC